MERKTKMSERLFSAAVAIFLTASLIVTPVYAQSQGQSQDQPSTPVQAQTPEQTQPQTQPPPEASSQSPALDQARNLKALSGPNYSKGRSPFPNIFAPYFPIHVAPPVLTNSPRLDQLIQDGKLMLSLDDAVSLALENNLDIAVQRYVPWIAETDLLRAKAGGIARGIGGTGTATALGFIPSLSYDPVITTNLNWQHATIPVNNPFLSGTGATSLLQLHNNNAQANLGYQQGFHTGTALTVAFDNSRSATSSPAALFNPSVQSTMIVGVQQQLLNGFGLLPNTRFILEAKNNLKIGDLVFAAQVITTVTQVQNFYWELGFARANVKVQQAAVNTSQKLYEDNKKQVEIGTLAPIEVVRAESELATDRQNLIVAQTTQLQDQTLLLNAITKNLVAPELLNIEIIPTTQIPTPPQTELLPLQDAVKEAWQKRPEIQQADLNLKNAGIEVKATRNALLPIATLFAQYSSTGLGGNATTVTSTPTAFAPNSATPFVDQNGNIIVVNGANGRPVFVGTPTAFTTTSVTKNGGFGDAASQVFQNNFPTYLFGLSFTLPIRNRSAQADNARALLDERQVETQYRQLQNTVAVDVRNAQIALEQDHARVEAAEKARVLAQQTLDAEQKKYQLGASTIFFVIQAQRDLTTAQGNELRAKADLAEAQVNFDKAMGRTLDVNHITVATKKGGHVGRTPLIPGTVSAEVVGSPATY
jgi:outer membrane protein